MKLLLGFVLALTPAWVAGQDTCENDAGCPGDDNCCSSFGFCGMGEGFCTPSARGSGTGGAGRARPTGRRRSGAGCTLQDTEWVGGDLPAILGGGGIRLDRDTADECFNRCEENPECRWYTYDSREELCYLKSGRGYTRNRTDGFVSGATFRDGCNLDPFCDSPYAAYGHQCLLFSSQLRPSLADVRRNINRTRELCDELGGVLPWDYSGYTGNIDTWHWVARGLDDSKCWACRPSRWRRGVRAFPCTTNLNFGCQRRTAFPLAAPRARPRLYTEPRLRPVASVDRLQPRRRPVLARRRPFRGSLRQNPFLYL